MKFISFGCWNKGDPNNPNLPLFWLYKKLEEIIEQGDINFIMITGDNYYYHHKDEKYDKTGKKLMKLDISFNQSGGGSDYCLYDDLKTSFEKLNKLNIPIYMCAGNHEYKKHKVVSQDSKLSPPTSKPSEPSESPPSKPQPGEKIDILYEERELLESKTGNHFLIEGEFNRNTSDTVFYAIDTTKTDDFPVIKVPKGKTKLYIFGHVPILSLKHVDKKERVKKGKLKKAEKDEWQCMSKLVEWFHNMDLPKVDLYYMCADTHNYQEIDITLSNNRVIRQVVVGSGGTFDMDMIGERKQIINKQDDKYEFAPCKSDNLSYLINRVRVLAITGLHAVCLTDTSTNINNFKPYFNAELGTHIPMKAGLKKRKKKITRKKKKKKKKKKQTKQRRKSR
tara:strand:- start:284 stop:1462 length:1179 start_codon:yes stop_codon:yes gene_type:complete